jgi:hypothetical protein
VYSSICNSAIRFLSFQTINQSSPCPDSVAYQTVTPKMMSDHIGYFVRDVRRVRSSVLRQRADLAGILAQLDAVRDKHSAMPPESYNDDQQYKVRLNQVRSTACVAFFQCIYQLSLSASQLSLPVYQFLRLSIGLSISLTLRCFTISPYQFPII